MMSELVALGTNSNKSFSLRTPCAMETPLGWSLLRPSMTGTVKSSCNVNFIAKTTTAITETVLCGQINLGGLFHN